MWQVVASPVWGVSLGIEWIPYDSSDLTSGYVSVHFFVVHFEIHPEGLPKDYDR